MAAAVYALVGERLNHIYRAVSAPVAAPTADTLFTIADWQIVLGGFPGKALRFSSAAADPKITVDLQMVTNGGFESSLTGWTTTGTVGTSATARTGSLAATVENGGTAYQDVICRSGEKIHVEAYIRQVTGTGTGTVTVQCLETGNFYNGSAWASSGSIGTNTTTSYLVQQADIVLEALSVTLSPLITIRITVTCTGGGANTLVDDVAAWPWTDWCSLHGHKYVDPRLAVTFRSSTDNFSASDTAEATMTIAQPSFYARLAAPVGRRYWQFRMTGTPRAAPYLDRLVIGQSYSFPVMPAHPSRKPWPMSERREQVRSQTLRGAVFTSMLSAQPRTSATLPFTFVSEAAFQEFRREMWVRSEGGVFPVVLAPDGAQPRVLYGLVAGDLEYVRTMSDATTGACYDTQLSVAELPTLASGL